MGVDHRFPEEVGPISDLAWYFRRHERTAEHALELVLGACTGTEPDAAVQAGRWDGAWPFPAD